MSVSFIILILLGIFIGTIGTLIGAGGGFILVPILILFFPHLPPESVTAISMAVVAANACIGSVAYTRSKKIDYKTGFIFAAATIPGSILGVLTTKVIPKHQFDILFSVVLIALSLYLFFKGGKKNTVTNKRKGVKGHVYRSFSDRYGEKYEYTYNMKYGIILSVFVGFFSPLLGIGGGIIHVPAMTEWLGFPVHVATATSHFILAIMATVSVIVHALEGNYNNPEVLRMVVGIVMGIIPGAFIGAHISRKVKGAFIVKALSLALGVVGIRIIIAAIGWF